MKRVLVFLVVVLLLSGSEGSSQIINSFDLASDEGGTTCRIVDVMPGVVEVHLVISGAIGVRAVQFGAPLPACWAGATWVGENLNPAYPVTIGDTQFNDPRGLSIAFPDCLDPPIYLGAMVFVTEGLALPCCSYPVVKVPIDGYPEIPGPIMVGCDFTNVLGLSGDAVINVEIGCDCMLALPTHQSTWGVVKQIYR